jgi:hypothetical protein
MTTAGDDALTAADLAAQALLGALLWDPRRARDVADWLTAEDFLRPDHGAIYATVVGMLADGRPVVDVFTVLESLLRGDHHDLHVDRTGTGPLSGPGLHSLISMTPATPRGEEHGELARSEHVRYARIVWLVAELGAGSENVHEGCALIEPRGCCFPLPLGGTCTR